MSDNNNNNRDSSDSESRVPAGLFFLPNLAGAGGVGGSSMVKYNIMIVSVNFFFLGQYMYLKFEHAITQAPRTSRAYRSESPGSFITVS
jgi:hypothetical protein